MIARALLALVLLGSVARADAPDPAEYDCRNHDEGDACETGVCTKATCTYGHPGAFQERACLKCMPGTPSSRSTRTPMLVGLGIGALALAGGIVFARRRGKRAA